MVWEELRGRGRKTGPREESREDSEGAVEQDAGT